MRTFLRMWLLLAVLILAGALYLLFPVISTRISILSNQQTAIARITSADCANGGAFSYSFTIKDIVQHGASSTRPMYCRDMKIGQEITVYYDADRPERSVLARPLPDLLGYLVAFAAICLLCPPILIWRIRFALRRA
jgi:hypothetical protein